jgi:hypothetical protein
MAIKFYPTIGSRSNFCTSFRRPFSLGLIWNPNSMTRKSGQPDLSKGSKLQKFSIQSLDRTQSFAQFSVGCFPWGCYGIATRLRGGLIG